MARLDSYDRLPSGMREYLSFNDYHFSKPMYMWAVSMMRDRNGSKVEPMTKESVMEILKRNNVEIEKDMGYDIPFVFMRKKTDSLGGSIPDEAHLAVAVKEFFTDKDGYDTMAFDEFLTKLNALGIPVDWTSML